MNELSTKSFVEIVKTMDDKHSLLLQEFQENMPRIQQATNNFGKTQSQFMNNMLTTSHPTPIRNIRQIMSEITRSIGALREAYYKNKKKLIEIKKLERDLESEKDLLEKEMMEVEIEEKLMEIESSKLYIAGAIRKISSYNQQYKNILNKMGVENIDEIDFEKEEEEYHIKKAFEQGLTAARSRGGRIDEGNQIYLSQIGINGGVAQKAVMGYLKLEETMIVNGQEPTAELQWRFLEDMYQKFKGSAIIYAKKKGMTLSDNNSLLDREYNKKPIKDKK